MALLCGISNIDQTVQNSSQQNHAKPINLHILLTTSTKEIDTIVPTSDCRKPRVVLVKIGSKASGGSRPLLGWPIMFQVHMDIQIRLFLLDI